MMMYCQVSFDAFSQIRLLKTSLKGIATAPKLILTTNRINTPRKRSVNKYVFRFVFSNLKLFQFLKEIQFIVGEEFWMNDFQDVF